jgi:ribose/xylose/arabinose/galactoside ABC-type transport system permease subunit
VTNLSNVLQNFCYIGMLAIGMTPILITGGIDISVGSVMGLCGVVLGLVPRRVIPSGRASERRSSSDWLSAPSMAGS